jgi:hypothetical protein
MGGYGDHIWNFPGLGDNCRTWQDIGYCFHFQSKAFYQLATEILTTPAGAICMWPQPFPRRTITGRCWPGVHRSPPHPESVNQGGDMFKIYEKDTF